MSSRSLNNGEYTIKAQFRELRRLGLQSLAVTPILVLGVAPAWAVPLTVDVLRNAMPGEGYLAYQADPSPAAGGRFGDEWTGWIDIRHPFLDGEADHDLGYDRSDHFVQVRSTILIDNMDVSGKADRKTDFNFAGKIYMLQAGLSVLETDHSPAGIVRFEFPIDTDTEFTEVAGNNGKPPSIDLYYGPMANIGVTFFPSYEAGGDNEHIILDNVRPNSSPPDTFAHELYHFLGDGQAVFRPLAKEAIHSEDPRNVVAGGALQWSPGDTKGVLDPRPPARVPDSKHPPHPPWDIAKSLEVVGPPASTTDGMPSGPPRVGGVDQLTSIQVQSIFADRDVAPFLPTAQHGDVNAAGNRVDWDFVADHASRMVDHDGNAATANVAFGLEGLTSPADNQQGVDALFWGIGTTTAPTHPTPGARDNSGHNHTGLGQFNAGEPDLAGPTFRFVDVFSLVTRYSDADIDSNGNASPRDRALDYSVVFRDAAGNEVPGVAIQIFKPGWTDETDADNFLARWKSPVAATGVLIKALTDAQHDGTAQIDAVIGANDLPAPQNSGAISFSVDGGLLNPSRGIAPNPAEGIESVFDGNPPNDVYVLGSAPPFGPAPGGHGLATEGEIFVSGTAGFDSDPNSTNIDRLSGALGNVPRIGPHAPVPAPSPENGVGVFGLVPNDNVNALSYGRDSGEVLYFSVDPFANGVPGSDVEFHAVLSPALLPPAGLPLPLNPGGGDPGNEAAGDVFTSQEFDPFGSYRAQHLINGKTAQRVAPPNDNLILFDEALMGLQAPANNGSALPDFREDDLDALELADPSDPVWGADFNVNGVIDMGDSPVYFSLDRFSPSIGTATNPFGGPIPLFTPSLDAFASADDILITSPSAIGSREDLNNNKALDGGEDLNGNGMLDPFVFGVFASGVLDIGLQPLDDLDALVLSDFGMRGFLEKVVDEALFSLAPGSPSLAMFGASPGDVFYTDFDRPFSPLVDWKFGGSLYASHSELGLLSSDNLNALDIRPLPSDRRLAAVPEPGTLLLFLTGLAGVLAISRCRPGAVGRNTEEDCFGAAALDTCISESRQMATPMPRDHRRKRAPGPLNLGRLSALLLI